MINLESITNENDKKHNEKWPYIPDHPYRFIIIGDSGSRKTNALINLINEQNDIIKIYFYARDLSELTFIECSNTMDDVYENINDYNLIRKRKTLIAFHDMIADIMTNKRFQARIK